MKRRTFVKNGMLVSSGLLLAAGPRPGRGSRPDNGGGPGGAGDRVESPYEITKRAVAEIGGMGRVVSRGDVVMVKPNIGWNRTVEQAACTNPEVLRAADRAGFRRRRQKGHGHGQHLPQGRGLLSAQRHRGHGPQGRGRGALQRREPPRRPRLQGRGARQVAGVPRLSSRWTSSSMCRCSSTTAVPG